MCTGTTDSGHHCEGSRSWQLDVNVSQKIRLKLSRKNRLKESWWQWPVTEQMTPGTGAQADVGLAMNRDNGCKEAANMVDLDSNPTKIAPANHTWRLWLTFSIVNDIAKYFAIIPAMLTFGNSSDADSYITFVYSHSAILSLILMRWLSPPLTCQQCAASSI